MRGRVVDVCACIIPRTPTSVDRSASPLVLPFLFSVAAISLPSLPVASFSAAARVYTGLPSPLPLPLPRQRARRVAPTGSLSLGRDCLTFAQQGCLWKPLQTVQPQTHQRRHRRGCRARAGCQPLALRSSLLLKKGSNSNRETETATEIEELMETHAHTKLTEQRARRED